jgi:hypothetical protein
VNVTRLIPAAVFFAIFVAHALYVGECAASAPSGWTDFGISAHVVGPLGLRAYWRGQDYFIGFSYALAAAFATWALSRSIFFRQTVQQNDGFGFRETSTTRPPTLWLKWSMSALGPA